MNKTPNKDYNLINYEDGNSDTIKESLDAFNSNFSKIDTDFTRVENNFDNMAEDFGEVITDIRDNITALADNYKPNTANGKNIYLTDSASAPIKEIQIGDGEIEQEEEPTPDSPQDVKVAQGNISIQTSNKNIVDFSSFIVLNSNVNASYIDDTLSISGTGTALGVRYNVKNFIKAHPGEKLIFSCSDLDISEYNSGTPNIVVLAINKAGQTSSTNMYNTSGVQTVYTIPDDVDDISTATFRLYSNNSSSISQTSAIKIVKPQLELRENSTEFVGHEGKTYPLTLPSGMFLGSIGTAKNYIHGTKNNWKFHKGLNIFDDMSTLTSNGINESRVSLLTPTLDIAPDLSSTQLANIVKCNSLPGTSINNSGLGGTTSNSRIRIYLSTEYATTYEEAKTFLSGKDIKIYYPLVNPTDETITDETLINQLNAISEMQTYSEETIIYSVTENLEPTLKIKYRVDPLVEVNRRLDALEARVTLLEG